MTPESTDGTASADGVFHVSRSIPIARATLWRPAPGGATLADMAPYPLFTHQKVLVAVQHHVEREAGGGFLGFLLGELCQCPDSGVRYAVADATVRLVQPIVGDQTTGAVARAWERLQAEVRKTSGQVLGWYHGHAKHTLALSREDIDTHERFFIQPWQYALVIGVEDATPVGGFFRSGRSPAWYRQFVPFYELSPESVPAGTRQSVLTWRNYHTDHRPTGRIPVHPSGAVAPPSAPTPAPPAARPTPPRPTPPPAEFAEAPPPPASTPLEPVRPPAPPRSQVAAVWPAPTQQTPPSPPAPAPPPSPPPPPQPPPPRPSRRTAPEARTSERRRPLIEPPPPPDSTRRQFGGPRLWVGSIVVILVAVGAAWFSRWGPFRRSVTGTGASPPAVATRSGPGAESTAARSVAATPGSTAVSVSAAPSVPSDSAPVRLEALGDSVTRVAAAYRRRAALFDAHRASCRGLATALVLVDEAWLAYNVQTRAMPRRGADSGFGRQDEVLSGVVDSVDQHFEASGCPRP